MQTPIWNTHAGILLRAVPYLGSHRILAVFTPDAGLLSVIAKHVHTNKSSWATPFCLAEWVVKPSRGDLHSLKEAALLDPLPHLLASYSCITAAGEIAQKILRSQLPHKAAPRLYQLLLKSLYSIPLNPEAVSLTFTLKLLQHEGVLHVSELCPACGAPATALSRGESVCLRHSSAPSPFEPGEWELFLRLGLARQFTQLTGEQISAGFSEKIQKIFAEQV